MNELTRVQTSGGSRRILIPTWPMRVARCSNQALPDRPHRSLGAIRGIHLAEDILHVLLDRLDADAK